MMTPAQIRTATVKDLRAAVKAMTSPAWRLKIGSRDDATRKEAAEALGRTWRALTELENSQLADIAQQLQDNEAALAKGREKLQTQLQRLERVADVLKAVTGLLDVVAKVVKVAL